MHLKPNMAGFDDLQKRKKFQMRTKGNVESPHSANVKFNIAGFKTSRAHKLFYGCKIQNSQLFFLEQKNGLSKWINHKSISKVLKDHICSTILKEKKEDVKSLMLKCNKEKILKYFKLN